MVVGKHSKTLQVIKNGILTVFLWITTALGALFVIAFFAIQIPFVQTRLVNNITQYLSEQTAHDIKINYVNISWFDSIKLQDFTVIDAFDSTMLSSEEVLIDFSLLDLIIKDDVTLDAVKLTNSGLYLQKVSDSTALNLTQFLRRLKGLRSTDSSNTNRSEILISKIKLQDAKLRIKDHRKGKAPTPWDYNDINYRKINCNLSELVIVGDTIKARVDMLSALDASEDLNIKSFRSNITLANEFLSFEQLDFQTDYSTIKDDLTLFYTDLSNLSFFKDSVSVRANLNESVIHPHDIQLFTAREILVKDPLKVTGILEGKVGRFSLSDLDLRIGRYSYFQGFVQMIGLPNVQETFMEIDIRNAYITDTDIKGYAPIRSHRMIDSLRVFRANGSFLGFYDDFVADANFTTALGSASTFINLKLPNKNFQGSYIGKLSLKDFEVGRLVGNNRIGRVTMSGSVNGTGFQASDADFYLNAGFDKLSYNNYSYSNITTNAEFSSQFFEGRLDIKDPNLDFDIDGTIDLRNNLDKVDFSGRIDSLNLLGLGLTENEIFISSNLDLDFIGLSLDSISGFVNLSDVEVRNNDRSLQLSEVSAISRFDDESRELTLENELVKFSALGDYTYSAIIKDLNRLWKEYGMMLRNNREELEIYYSYEPEFIERYDIDLNLEVSDADPFIGLFTDKISLGKDTRIKGKFIHGATSILTVNTQLDTLQYEDYLFLNNEFDLNASKLTDQADILSMLYVSSERQVISRYTSLNDFFLEAIWSGNQIDFSTNLQQVEQDNQARIYGDILFSEAGYELMLRPSELRAIGREWAFAKDNSVTLDQEGNFTVENLGIRFEDQSIQFNGGFGKTSNDKLNVAISNFELDNLNPLINQKIGGLVNTEAVVSGWGEELLIESDVTVDSLQLNDFLVGELKGNSSWESSFDRLRIGLLVDRLQQRVIQIGGFFYPDQQQQLDLIAKFDGTSMKVIAPFLQKHFSNIDGQLNGEFIVEGRLDYPVLKGEGEVTGGALTVNYLNTDYTFDGSMIFEENEIGVRDLLIHDVNRNTATANGGVFHDGFRNFILDITTNLKKFQVLNTNSVDNELYYGTAYLTGDVNFLGALDNLTISAQTTTNKDTRIFIPLSSSSTIEQEEFIQFVNLSENKPNNQVVDDEPASRVNLKGIKLDFDLDITPDAYTELIFDIKSGDIIRGRGNGKINLQINTDGDFMMFGDLDIVTGGYNFTLKNIINKEFELIQGSRISWYGDPYQGVMDITAEYSQLTSLLPLISQDPSDALINSPDARRKYPATVVLNLEGPLLSPAIDFDIKIVDYPESISGFAVGPLVNAFSSKINSDEQELKRQVFSLIVLRRFSPENSFNVGGGQTLGSSVSEFISNQLSYWVSQVDENLEIDVDLTSLDQDAFNTFQLRLAYTFLDGRLKVSRDGGFTNVDQETDISTVVGDWTVEYLITSDGKLRAKMYNKTNYNVVDRTLNDQNNTTTGFSIQYTKSFDQFRELLFKARKKPKIPEPAPEEKPNAVAVTPEGRNEED